MIRTAPSDEILSQQADAAWNLRHCGEYDDPELHRERYSEATSEIALRLAEWESYRSALDDIATSDLKQCNAGSLVDIARAALDGKPHPFPHRKG